MTGSSDKFVILWDLEDEKRSIVLKGHHGTVNCILNLHDGRNIATGSSEKRIIIWDIATGKMI